MWAICQYRSFLPVILLILLILWIDLEKYRDLLKRICEVIILNINYNIERFKKIIQDAVKNKEMKG